MSRSTEGLFEELAINTHTHDIPTLIETMRSSLLLEPIASKFGLNQADLSKRIKITTGGVNRQEAEGILKVVIRGKNTKKDQELLTDVSQVYLDTVLLQRQKRLRDGVTFLNAQGPSLQAKVNQIQTKITDFRQSHSLLEPNVEGLALKRFEDTISNKILELEAERNRLILVRDEILKGNIDTRGFEEAISTGDGGDRAGVQGLEITDSQQGLIKEIIKLENELAKARSKYQPTSSTVKSLQKRLDGIRPLLKTSQLKAVNTALKLNSGRLKTAEDQKKAINKRFLKQPELIKEFEALQSQLTLARGNLAGLVKARESFQLELAQQSIPWRIIESPKINPIPVKPSVPRDLAMGLMLGVVAGVGTGLIRDTIDNVFHDKSEVVDLFEKTLLGHIPNIKHYEDLDQTSENQYIEDNTSKNEENLFYQEAFNNFIATARLTNIEQTTQTVALTSTLPSEGKTLINILLAKTLAEMRQKVLIVDANLRKPKIHMHFGLKNQKGLVDILSGSEKDWNKAVQKSDMHNNLDVITAGRKKGATTQLISSISMRNFIGEIKNSQEYDLILFDTPHVLDLADTIFIAEQCDHTIMIISLGLVDRDLSIQAVKRISDSNASLMGIITNSNKSKTARKNTSYIDQEDTYTAVNKDSDKDDKTIIHKAWAHKITRSIKKLMDWVEK